MNPIELLMVISVVGWICCPVCQFTCEADIIILLLCLDYVRTALVELGCGETGLTHWWMGEDMISALLDP